MADTHLRFHLQKGFDTKLLAKGKFLSCLPPVVTLSVDFGPSPAKVEAEIVQLYVEEVSYTPMLISSTVYVRLRPNVSSPPMLHRRV